MQYAEKVALVPQHYLEDREYKQIQKPGAAVARGALSLDIKRILDDDKQDDDQKVKRYVNALHRYVNIRDRIPVAPEVQSNPITTPRKRKQDADDEKKKKTGRRRRHAKIIDWERYA